MHEHAERELEYMTQAILKKIAGFFDVSEDVGSLFSAICKDRIEITADTSLVSQGGAYSDVFLLDSGWVLRSRGMDNGSRQIVNVALPGDFIALNALLFERSDFELRTKTDILAFRFDPRELSEALKSDASLAAALFWVNTQEESILAERIVSLGRRNARQRVCHVLCEFISRLEIIGVADASQLVIPLSQEEFSDILGISVVHANKTLKALERDEIISFRNAILMVQDRVALEREAGFEDGYLHFTRRADKTKRNYELIQ